MESLDPVKVWVRDEVVNSSVRNRMKKYTFNNNENNENNNLTLQTRKSTARTASRHFNYDSS